MGHTRRKARKQLDLARSSSHELHFAATIEGNREQTFWTLLAIDQGFPKFFSALMHSLSPMVELATK